jgi:small subunit ribosomal protein S8
MAINDPVGDMLTRIRNAQLRRRNTVTTPGSKLRARVLDEARAFFALPVDEKMRVHMKHT